MLPARELCAEARRRGIVTVVDGAHAPAMIPLDVTAVGADFYAGNCHKWLLAPTGAGFLVVGPGNEDRLEPLHVSWGYQPDSTRSATDAGRRTRTPATSSARRRGSRFLEFEGTRDVCPWLAVPDGHRLPGRHSASSAIRGADRRAGGVHPRAVRRRWA